MINYIRQQFPRTMIWKVVQKKLTLKPREEMETRLLNDCVWMNDKTETVSNSQKSEFLKELTHEIMESHKCMHPERIWSIKRMLNYLSFKNCHH